MIEKRVLIPDRIRKVPPSFSWVDHRFLRLGYLDQLSPEGILLYFFLVLVSDSRGLSYYSTQTLSKHLKLSSAKLRFARTQLVQEGLVAYQPPLYQVLSLPVPLAPPLAKNPSLESGPASLGKILSSIRKEIPHGP
jgi:hypothetical protein